MLYEQPRLYDRLYDGFVEDVAFYAEILRSVEGPICELACGTGRVTVPLAEAGFALTAVDSSEAMLASARKRAIAAGVQERISLRRGDMREAAAEAELGAVLVPLHSLSHLHTLDDLQTALGAMHRSLRPGGALVLALHNPSVSYLGGDGGELRRIHRELSSLTVYETFRYDSVTQLLHLVWYVETAEETRQLRYSLRMIFPEELRLLLASSGFELESRYGWYDFSPFTHESGSQLVLARRPG